MNYTHDYTAVDFSGMDLRNQHLSGTFIGCDFRGADLRGAQLVGTFMDCDFTGAIMDRTTRRFGRFV